MKAGDIVKVTNWGQAYSTNYHWFDKFKGELEYRWMLCYAFNDHTNYDKFWSSSHKDRPKDEREYVVLFVGDNKALITERNRYDISKKAVSASVYLVGVDGLEIVYSKNSADDTSEENTDDEPDNENNSNNPEVKDLEKLAVKAFVDWLFS